MRPRGTVVRAQWGSAGDPFSGIDGNSPVIRDLKAHMLRVARDAEVTVLIVGESGTGKERVARAIHQASPRQRAPLVVVNCAGLTPTLVEDELFGHVRGAFTGAVTDRPGPFERASGGTVVLDEVGDLPPDLQMKLLRALQERAVQRLGGRDEKAFDVRVIAATNVDLAVARARGRFRDDLYYRLKVYEIRVPPLRARGAEDVAALAGTLLERCCARRRRRAPGLDEGLLELLVRHHWPGNVRELENTIEYLVVRSGGESPLTAAHLPEDFARSFRRREDAGGLPSSEACAAALERSGQHRGRAAAALGVSRHQLYRLLRRRGPGVPTREGG
jgi:transcriptional regulator with PAS, ATPase and Fis domain